MVDSPEPKLLGKRVLVVEDSFLVASSIATMLEDLGCRVIGPCATVDDAISALASQPIDAGVLDMNLAGATSEPVAAELLNRGVPFFFVTGYLSPALTNPRFATLTRINKPITEATLADALNASLGV